MLKRILLLCLIFSCSLALFAQDFNFAKLNNPAGKYFNQYIGQIGETAILTFYDVNFNTSIYTFDGVNLTQLTAPTGFSFSYVAGQNEETYFLIFDDVNFNSTVFQLDENGLEALFAVDPNDFFGGFQFAQNGLLFFSIFDFNFNSTLRYFDGNNLVPVALPNNNYFGGTLAPLNDHIFLTLEDNFGNESIYGFDGTTFTPLTTPFPLAFATFLVRKNNGLYLGLYNNNFDQFLYFFDGNSLTEVPLPSGFIGLGYYAGKIKDRIFFGLDNANFEGTLHELEDNGNWIKFDNPPGYFYNFPAGPLESEEALYPIYADANFFYSMVVFDGSSLTVVPNPSGFEYSNYYRDYKTGHLVSYRDINFNNRLHFYEAPDLTLVANPSGYNFNTYSFQLGTKLYLEFVDANFDGTLFSLALNIAPLSADRTVDTERETPYQFKVSDFAFSDEDVDDTFQGVQIVDLPGKGLLHVFGAPVSSGQFIPVDDLPQLTYLPLENGTGSPFDNFTFKVSDGNNLSDELYHLYINVHPVVGVANQLLAGQMQINPNPASDFFTLTIENLSAFPDTQIALIGSNGEIWETRKLDETTERFDLNGLPPGFYQVLIYNQHLRLHRGIIVTK